MSENKDNQNSDESNVDADKKPDGFSADAIQKKIDSYADGELVKEHIGANKRIHDLNYENKVNREKVDASDKKLNELLKTIEDSKNKDLEDNQKYEELYKTEKEKNETMIVDYDSLKVFRDDQIKVMELKITEMEGKLSNGNKGLWETFKGNEGITHAKKIEFLNQLVVEDGINVDGTRSKGGALVDASKMTLDQKNVYFKEHGKLPV